MDEKLRHLLEDESTEIERDPDVVRQPGSKPQRETRPWVLQIRLSEDEYAALERDADRQHLPTSTYARKILLDRR